MVSRKSMDLGDRQTWFWTLMPTLETLEPHLPPQENGDNTAYLRVIVRIEDKFSRT